MNAVFHGVVAHEGSNVYNEELPSLIYSIIIFVRTDMCYVICHSYLGTRRLPGSGWRKVESSSLNFPVGWDWMINIKKIKMVV